MMKLTSAEACKLLSKLNDECSALEENEKLSSTFVASIEENVEDVRPEYDYESRKQQLSEIEGKVRKLKHALNLFNATTIVPEMGITIDEMLVLLPQLNNKKNKLTGMASALPKTREPFRTNFIDYKYTNYDISLVRKDLESITDELAKAQLALDTINHTATFEVDI